MAYLCVLALCVLAFMKYIRLVVNCTAYWRYKPTPLSDDPKYTREDVTVVIPSLDGDSDELRRTVRSVLETRPLHIMLVTIDENLEKAERMIESIGSKAIQVFSIPKANKRQQMCRAIPYITTSITIFADDDVSWPVTLLPWILAPFKDSQMGGVGTNQRLRREQAPNIWNFFGAAYLIRRNWDCTACIQIDGGLPCLSGRTVAYRTLILQDPEFQDSFQNETWRSCQLNADDDNFLTRWMMNHEWKTFFQSHKDCEVQTTLENNATYLKQCNRWARSNWRSNLTTLSVERTVWRRHPWSVFAVFQTTLSNWSCIADALMIWCFWQISTAWDPKTQMILRISWLLWVVMICRIFKYSEHFSRYPQDLKFLPLIPLFGYFHSCVIKTYALATMHATTWGSREGADTNDVYRMIRLPDYESTLLFAQDRDLSSKSKPANEMKNLSILLDESSPVLPKYEPLPEYRNLDVGRLDCDAMPFV